MMPPKQCLLISCFKLNKWPVAGSSGEKNAVQKTWIRILPRGTRARRRTLAQFWRLRRGVRAHTLSVAVSAGNVRSPTEKANGLVLPFAVCLRIESEAFPRAHSSITPYRPVPTGAESKPSPQGMRSLREADTARPIRLQAPSQRIPASRNSQDCHTDLAGSC